MRTILRALPLFLVAALLASASLATPARAAFSPLGFALVAPVQFPPAEFSVTGARVSVGYGRHRDVYGLDLGLVGNITEGSFGGIGVSGVFNYNKGMSTVVGLQLAGIANVNVNKARIVGLQLAAGMNMNQAESSLVGVGLALANVSPFTNVYGLQAGVYNSANHVYGFQIGLINSAQTLHGLQIGLLNFNRTGLFAVAPILNVGF
jgi:hypothetical protein